MVKLQWRGFSENKELEIENLGSESLDYVNAVGGILNVPLTQQQENFIKGTWTNNNRTRNLKKEVACRSLCWAKLRNMSSCRYVASVNQALYRAILP